MHSALLQKREDKPSKRLHVLVPILLFGAACILLTTILHLAEDASPLTDTVEKEVAVWQDSSDKTCVDISFTCMGDFVHNNRAWSTSIDTRAPPVLAPHYVAAQGPKVRAAAPLPAVPNHSRIEDAVGTMRKLLADSLKDTEYIGLAISRHNSFNDPIDENDSDVEEDESASEAFDFMSMADMFKLDALQAQLEPHEQPELPQQPQAQAPPGPVDEELIPYVGDNKMPYVCTPRHSAQALDCTLESKFDDVGNIIGAGGLGSVTLTDFKAQPGLVSPFADLDERVVVKRVLVEGGGNGPLSADQYIVAIGMVYREAIVGAAVHQRAPGLAVRTVDVYKDQDPTINYITIPSAILSGRNARAIYLVQQPLARANIQDRYFKAFLQGIEVYYIATVADTLLHMVDLMHNTAGFTHIDLKGENIYFLHKENELALILGDLGSALPIPTAEDPQDKVMQPKGMPGVETSPEAMVRATYMNIEAHDVWCVVEYVFKIYFGFDRFHPRNGWSKRGMSLEELGDREYEEAKREYDEAKREYEEAKPNGREYDNIGWAAAAAKDENVLELLKERVGQTHASRKRVRTPVQRQADPMLPFFAKALTWHSANRNDIATLRGMLEEIILNRNTAQIQNVRAKYVRDFALQIRDKQWPNTIQGNAMIPNWAAQ